MNNYNYNNGDYPVLQICKATGGVERKKTPSQRNRWAADWTAWAGPQDGVKGQRSGELVLDFLGRRGATSTLNGPLALLLCLVTAHSSRLQTKHTNRWLGREAGRTATPVGQTSLDTLREEAATTEIQNAAAPLPSQSTSDRSCQISQSIGARDTRRGHLGQGFSTGGLGPKSGAQLFFFF